MGIAWKKLGKKIPHPCFQKENENGWDFLFTMLMLYKNLINLSMWNT